MRKLFLIVLFSLTIVVLSLIFFLKITLIVLGVGTVSLLILFKLAPLLENKAKIKSSEIEQPLRKDELIA